MKHLLLRLYHWLGRLLGLDTAPGGHYRRETDGLPRAGGLPPIAGQQPTTTAPPPPTPAPPLEPVRPLPARDSATDEPPRFVLNQSLLTYQERKFYLTLLRAVEGRYEVMVKVRLGDLIRLANHPPDEKFHRNQVVCKHLDFVLCTPGMLRPLLAVELDDPSHRWPDAVQRDQFKNDLCAAVGLPLLRIEMSSSYAAPFLRDQIAANLGNRGQGPGARDYSPSP